MPSTDPPLIHELIDRRARQNRDDPFCYFEDDVITFGMLDEESGRLASGLAEVGVGANDRVAVMLPNHPDHIYIILALLGIGAVHVPLNVHQKAVGLGHVLGDSAATTVIADRCYDGALAPFLTGKSDVKRVLWRGGLPAAGEGNASTAFEELRLRERERRPVQRRQPDRLVSVTYTSGTTGPAKGVLLTERMYRAAAESAGLAADVRPGDVLFLWEPLYHIAGVQTVVLCLQRGVPCALVERFSASGFWNQVRRYGATQIHYLGGVVGLLMKQPQRPDDRDNPARIAWGAAAPPELWPGFEQRFGVRIQECYGLTEGSSFTTINRDGRVGSVGKPVDHFEVRIAADDGTPLPHSRVGEIVQRAREPGLVMKGYLNDPDGTREALCGGWLHTGDLGYCDSDGFFYYAGRKSDSIRSRGERISAWEVERVVNACPGVEECAVIGVPSEFGESHIKVFVRPEVERSLDPLELVRWCDGRLPYFQVPRYVAVVDSFPRTPSERIRKEELSRSVDDCWDLDQSGYRLSRSG